MNAIRGTQYASNTFAGMPTEKQSKGFDILVEGGKVGLIFSRVAFDNSASFSPDSSQASATIDPTAPL